jgi:hypothetical protein
VTYNNCYTGEIVISPPLTRQEIAKVRDGFCPAIQDVKLRITEKEMESEDGESVTIRPLADAIVPLSGPYTGNSVVDDIQTLIDYFSNNEFKGYIEAWWDPGYGDSLPTRYYVAGRRVVEVRPKLVWPGEESIA